MSTQFGNHQALVWPESGSAAQAAYWFTLIDSDACTAANRRAFALWRRDNADNEDAYLALIDQCLAVETLADDIDILALRRQALELHRKPLSRSRTIFAMAACLLVAVTIWTVTFSKPASLGSIPIQVASNEMLSPPLGGVDHHVVTAVGEQTTKMLTDGSRVILNTDSEVRIQFTADKRRLYLLRGQAFFDVAHDADRPFIVYANGQRVTALGTQFDVRITEKDVQVILLEGKVKIDELIIPDAADTENQSVPVPVKSVELAPGQKFSSLESEAETADETVIENVRNWKKGLINYSGEPLADVVAELNRYSVRQIKLADPAIGKLGISGTLKTGSIDQQAVKLAAIYDLRVATDPQTQTLVIDWKQQ